MQYGANPTTQSWENRKTRIGTQILGPRTISPEPKMQSTWNLHSSQPLWSSNWLQSFNLIGRSKLEIFEKPDFSPKLWLIFSLDFRHKGAEMVKNRWTIGERGTLELSENHNRFQFASLVTEIWAIEKRYFFQKINLFWAISREPDFCRICGFRQNEPTFAL